MSPPGQTPDAPAVSARTSAGVQTPRAGAFSLRPSDTDSTQLAATSTGDELVAAKLALRERGITNPDEFAALTADVILGTCRWFDDQKGRVGAGVLVAELRAGGRQPKRSLAAAQDEYAASIVAWLWKNFPALCDERWGPHPAAIAEVIRLHWRHGKGQLRRSEHGPAIRAAVKRFDARHGTGAKA